MHQEFLEKAVQLATENSESGINGPFGALIVRDNIILSEGWNCVVEYGDPTAHAEIIAIRAACKKLETYILKDCIMYSSCEPCPMCLAAIHWARISQIFFAASRSDAANAGFDDEYIYKSICDDSKQSLIKAKQIKTDNFLLPFYQWEKNTGKIKY